MNDTHRVTVPVEAVELLKRHMPMLEAAASPAKSEVFVVCGHEAREMHDAIARLSAAPAPEGGAAGWLLGRFGTDDKVEFTHEEMIETFEAGAQSALATREEAPADHHERNLSMTNDELIEQALSSPPLEAPAEAGEREKLIQDLSDAERWRRLPGNENHLATAALFERAISALRAQPPAREDAQPVATIDGEMVALPPIAVDGPHRPCEHRLWLARQLLDSRMSDAEAYSTVAFSPAITDLHPAPDALRLAVEALEKIKAVRVCKESANIWTGADACRKIATEALDALQAEQKGGA